MTSKKHEITAFAHFSTLVGAALGFSILFLFALSSFVNMIYDGDKPAPTHQMVSSDGHEDPNPAQKPSEETPSTGEAASPKTPETKPASPETTKADPMPPKTETAPAKPTILQMLATADVKKGNKVAKKCAACHTFNKGGKNRVGPNLFSILGKPIATGKDFKYSPAMKTYAGSAESWNYQNLIAYLKKPKKVVPKTKMAFAGIKKDKDLANLIAYMRQQSDQPAPLPDAQ